MPRLGSPGAGAGLRAERLRSQRTLGRHGAIGHQEGRANKAKHDDGGRRRRHEGADAQYSCSDKNGVGQGADRNNRNYVLPADSLP